MFTFSVPLFQGKIAKDARECAQECVSEFISFITSEASDRCQVNFVFLSENHRQSTNMITRQFVVVSQIMKFIISLFNRLKSERRSTARISCSRCRRWASTITWSRSSSTCRSIGKQRKEINRAQKDSKTLEKMFYVNIL